MDYKVPLLITLMAYTFFVGFLAYLMLNGGIVIRCGKCRDTIEVTCAIYDKGGMCCAPTDRGKFFFKPAINETIKFFGKYKYSLTNGTYLSCKEVNYHLLK